MDHKDLLHGYWYAKMRGRDATFSASAIEPDGRKRDKTVRSLIVEGVIQPGPSYPDVYVVSLMYADAKVVAVRPDLAALAEVTEARDIHILEQLHGSPLTKLTTENLRYVAEHVADYKFFDRWGKPRDPSAYDGERISDDAFQAALAARKLDLQIARAIETNLPWGLSAMLGALTKDEAKEFERGSSPFEGLSGYGTDPDKWGDAAEAAMRAALDTIERNLARVRVIHKAQQAVAAFGGWPKFVDTYKIEVEKRIREETVKKELAATKAEKPA